MQTQYVALTDPVVIYQYRQQHQIKMENNPQLNPEKDSCWYACMRCMNRCFERINDRFTNIMDNWNRN